MEAPPPPPPHTQPGRCPRHARTELWDRKPDDPQQGKDVGSPLRSVQTRLAAKPQTAPGPTGTRLLCYGDEPGRPHADQAFGADAERAAHRVRTRGLLVCFDDVTVRPALARCAAETTPWTWEGGT